MQPPPRVAIAASDAAEYMPTHPLWPLYFARLGAHRLPSVAADLQVAGNARLERQAHATIPEPTDVAALLDRSEQRLARADARDEDPALERSDQTRVVLARVWAAE